MQTQRLVIDALAACKGNVLPWHVEDSPDFSRVRGQTEAHNGSLLSKQCTPGRMSDISFARDRAVAIVIEIDVPAHARHSALATHS